MKIVKPNLEGCFAKEGLFFDFFCQNLPKELPRMVVKFQNFSLFYQICQRNIAILNVLSQMSSPFHRFASSLAMGYTLAVPLQPITILASQIKKLGSQIWN